MSSVDGRLLNDRWTEPFDDTPASDLLQVYAAIGRELGTDASMFGKNTLRAAFSYKWGIDGLSGVPSIFEYVGGATDCPATGQLKTFIDRTFGRYREMKDKEFFYLTACADPEESTADWAVNAFRGFVMCLPHPTERGMVKAIGMGRKGAVKGSQYEEEAYNLGKRI